MKFYYLLFCILLCAACDKKGSNLPDDTSTVGEFAYEVQADSIVRSPANSPYNFVFNIKLLSGKIQGNYVTCFIEGLPAAIGVSPENVVVGNLLGGVFSFDVGNVPVGDYPFRLKTITDKYGDAYTDLILRITAVPDIVPHLAGIYDSSYDYCPDSGLLHYSVVLSAIADSPHVLVISNFRNLGTGVTVHANVVSGVDIPIQSVGDKTVWGTGTYNIDARPDHGGDYVLSINDTIVSGLDTLTCTMHIEH